MPLTPEDVRNKLFTTVRLREGYEQAEVDEFLDEVEAELTRLIAENEDLRAKLAAALGGEPMAAQTPPAPTPEPLAEPAAPTAPEPVAAPQPPPPPPPQQIIVRTADDIGEASARVLAAAQRVADETVAEARADADRMVEEARESADRLTSEAKSKADELDRETRERSAAFDAELAEQREQMLGRLEQERARLESEVEDLKSFEREYRGRLRSFLEGQLHQLQTRGSDDTPLAPAGGPETTGAGRTVSSSAQVATGDSASTGGKGDGNGGGNSPSTPAGQPQSALGRILEEEERNGSDES